MESKKNLKLETFDSDFIEFKCESHGCEEEPNVDPLDHKCNKNHHNMETCDCDFFECKSEPLESDEETNIDTLDHMESKKNLKMETFDSDFIEFKCESHGCEEEPNVDPLENETPATTTTAASTCTSTAANTQEGVPHAVHDTASPDSEDDEMVVVPASKVQRKPRTTNHPPMKPGAAIDSVIDVAKQFLSKFNELSADTETEGMRHFFESLLPMVHNIGPRMIPVLKMEILACLTKYEEATQQGAEVPSQDLRYYMLNCRAPSPPKAQPIHQQQQVIFEPQQLQQFQQLQQQQLQQQQLLPQLPATFSTIRQQGQPTVTSLTPQQLQLLQQQYLLKGPSNSMIGVPSNNTSDLNMSLLFDMQLPGQASTSFTPAKTPPLPQSNNTTLNTPTSSADV